MFAERNKFREGPGIAIRQVNNSYLLNSGMGILLFVPQHLAEVTKKCDYYMLSTCSNQLFNSSIFRMGPGHFPYHSG